MKPVSQDAFEYAFANTRVLQEPDRRIDTFGDTRFRFQLITEPMDQVGQTCLREGEVEAVRPRIIKPEGLQSYSVEGFGDDVRSFLEKLRSEGKALALVRYGFQLRRTHIQERVLNTPLAVVRDQLMEQARTEGHPELAILEGIDDTWEVSLLRFALDMIEQSSKINLFDFQRRGLL